MTTLRRVGLISAFRSGFWMGVALYFTAVIIALAFIVTFGGLAVLGELPSDFAFNVFRSALMSGLLAAITWTIVAVCYNITSRFGGGLQFEFEQQTPAQDDSATDDDTQIV